MQFLTLAAFVVVAFGCAFYVLLESHEDLPIQAVVGLLVRGTLNGESDYVISSTHAHASLFAWSLMFLFGVIVVLLLLNLLIARFAKTFDMVYENVDANFKVAFARVVIDGMHKELLPPPFNLLRALVLFAYGRLEQAAAYTRSTRLRSLVEWRWLLDVLPTSPSPWVYVPLSAADDHHSTSHVSLHRVSFDGLSDRYGVGDGDDEPHNGDESVAHEVAAFLRTATNAKVALIPEGVEDYVLDHQHDVRTGGLSNSGQHAFALAACEDSRTQPCAVLPVVRVQGLSQLRSARALPPTRACAPRAAGRARGAVAHFNAKGHFLSRAAPQRAAGDREGAAERHTQYFAARGDGADGPIRRHVRWRTHVSRAGGAARAGAA